MTSPMSNEELISTLHDKAMALNFETRRLIFEALKRLEALTEAPEKKKRTNIQTEYVPVAKTSTGEWRRVTTIRFCSPIQVEQYLEENRYLLEKCCKISPEDFKAGEKYKIMKRKVITIIGKWEDI